ncbi:hypothetical protein B0H15DRAFT_947492 [Mycena belliarum]|uniref:Uncharacterized protein n=1 Tax=Mycena belliarum TaxID=1033014 RepID=A0AAD6XUC6_9AGAR|nr:hypothetical protein B0H15DRAFT_947492 [Mycena belliae]
MFSRSPRSSLSSLSSTESPTPAPTRRRHAIPRIFSSAASRLRKFKAAHSYVPGPPTSHTPTTEAEDLRILASLPVFRKASGGSGPRFSIPPDADVLRRAAAYPPPRPFIFDQELWRDLA